MKVEVEGFGEVTVSDQTLAEEEILPGELYVGKRNTGWHLGTFRARLPDPVWGYIYDEEYKMYPFNAGECRKVML